MSQTTKKLIFWVKHPLGCRKKDVWTILTAQSPRSQTATERRRRRKNRNTGGGILQPKPAEAGAINFRSNNWCDFSQTDYQLSEV